LLQAVLTFEYKLIGRKHREINSAFTDDAVIFA